MAIETPSTELPERIRQAVASGEFAKARLLWAEYGNRFCEDLRRGPVPHSRLQDARQLAEWTRATALCARAFARDRLAQIAVSRRYGCAGHETESSVAVRG